MFFLQFKPLICKFSAKTRFKVTNYWILFLLFHFSLHSYHLLFQQFFLLALPKSTNKQKVQIILKSNPYIHLLSYSVFKDQRFLKTSGIGPKLKIYSKELRKFVCVAWCTLLFVFLSDLCQVQSQLRD